MKHLKNNNLEDVICNIQLEDVEGKTLEGMIPMILPKGEYSFPNVDEIQNKDAIWLQEWIEEAGLKARGDTNEERIEFTKDMATMCAFLLPSIDINSEEMKLFMWIVTLSFLGDDVLEGKDILGRDIDKAKDMAAIAGDIFCGKYNSLDSISFHEESFGFKSMIKAGFVAAQKAKDFIPDFFKNSNYFANSIRMGYCAMSTMELEDHYDDTIGELPEDSFRYLRKFDGGFQAFIELAWICVRAVPSQHIRNDVLFQRIFELAWSINVNINDIFSVRKEIDSGIGYNLVVYKSRNIDLNDAFNQVLNIIVNDIINLKALCKRYRYISKGDQLVHHVLQIMENMVDGHIYWYTASKRYGALRITFT